MQKFQSRSYVKRFDSSMRFFGYSFAFFFEVDVSAYLLLHDGYRSHIVALVPERSLCAQVTNYVYLSMVWQGTRSSLASVNSFRSHQFVPNLRSGSFANIGPRRYMEDEHIRIDDLSENLGTMFRCPTPSAFYGVTY